MATGPFHSTPPKATTRGYVKYSAKPTPLAKERRERLRKNMEGYYLGPMDPADFMDAFMPINSPNFGSPPENIDFAEVYCQISEKLMYDPFVSRSIILQQ